MNNKILLGSAISVVIIILVSFTSVIGYRSVESDVKVSPLFNIRSSKAIGKESKDLNRRYVGKGNTLPFPERDDKTVLVQKVIDNIRRMDDKTFERFIASVIDFSKKDNRFNGVNPDRIREALYLLRNSNILIPIVDANAGNITFGYGLKGVLVCILLLPFTPILVLFIWCFNIGVQTARTNPCTLYCPITLRKL